MATATVTPFGLSRVLTTAFHHKSRQERYTVHDEAAEQPKTTTKAPVSSNQPVGAKKSKQLARKWKRVTLRQVLRLTHRFLIMCAAFVYIVMSFQASWDAFSLLDDSTGAYAAEGTYTSDALGLHIGTTTLRESSFVIRGLGNDTRPRNATLYYDMETMSFEVCEAMSPGVYDIYSTEFQQTLYTAITTGAAYNLTFLAASEIELIVPLVDCTNHIVTSGDETMANLNFLVRRKQNPDDVFMLTFTFVNQAYKIYSQKEYGPAAVGTLTFINDLRATRVDSYFLVSLGYPFEPLDFRVYELVGWSDHGSWLLQRVVSDEPGDLVKVVRTGTRSGFFMTTDSDQTNIFTEHWEVSTTDPIAAITGPTWLTKSATHDSWAWAHLLQLIFGVNHLLGLVVLMMVSYRNFIAGKLWIGDAFVAISDRTLLRGLHVFVSWYFNGFWAIFEFCIYDANQLTHSMNMTIFESIILVDLFTIYLSLCGILGKVFRERIDPLLVIVSFFLGVGCRHDIIYWFPTAKARLMDFVSEFYQLGSPDRIQDQEKIAPMKLWNTHELKSISADVICFTLLPIFCTLVIVLMYIVIRKVHRHFHPDPMRVEKASSLMTTAKSETGAGSKASKE